MDRAELTTLLQSLSQAATPPLEVWLAFIYVLCMFAVTTLRPQQISSVGLFRLSYILFTFYLIIPSLVNTIVAIINADRRNLGRPLEPSTAEQIVLPLFQALGRVLFAIAILCGLAALRHHQRRDLPPALEDDR